MIGTVVGTARLDKRVTVCPTCKWSSGLPRSVWVEADGTFRHPECEACELERNARGKERAAAKFRQRAADIRLRRFNRASRRGTP